MNDREAAERAYTLGIEAIRKARKQRAPHRVRYTAAVYAARGELFILDDIRQASVLALLRFHAFDLRLDRN